MGGAGVSTHVRVGERSYEVSSSAETNVNDTDDYLFALPRTSGRLTLRDASGRTLHEGGVGPGDVRVVVPGERSAMQATQRFESVVLAVPAAFCHELADEVGIDSADGIFGRQPVLRPPAPVHRLAGWLCDAARTDDEPARHLVLSGLAIALVGAALGGADRPALPPAHGFDPDQLRRVTEFADLRLAGSLTLVEWSAAVGVPVNEFGRRFARSFGVAPYTWYLDRRIDAAMTHLLDGGMSLSEIALQTGFSSQSHFTTAFRRRVGMPPGQWRSRSARPGA